MIKKQKTVIVLEDDEILLSSYKYIIDTIEGYNLIGAFKSVNEALKDYDKLFPDIIVSDISMPGLSGIDGIEHFKKMDNEVKIILISVHDDIDFIMNAINHNTDGYLTKPVTKSKLEKTFKDIERGGAVMSEDVTRKVFKALKKNKSELFSDRETEIIELLAKGFTYSSMAEQLFISTSTVNFHLQNIYTKLDVKSKSDALKKLAEMNCI